jgi:hypothetical protein
VTELAIDLTALDNAKRRDLANDLLRAARCAAHTHTRIVLLDLSEQIDGLISESRDSSAASLPQTLVSRGRVGAFVLLP